MDHAIVEEPKPGYTDSEAPDLWYSGAKPTLYPLPDKEKSWGECNKLAQDIDKSRYDTWKDDVEKMLIFAGLFSGVVTGFTTQAYQMLKVDSATATAQLLAIMAQQQLVGNSSTDSDQQQLLPIISGLQSFTPAPYAIRVNILWFLSLSVSLMTAIVGLLCMQWLHEYQRETTSLPHMETFAMCQMRREGLEKWKVPTILYWVSFFLQMALVLFFIGLLDFLWHLNGAKTVATVISVFSAIAFSFLTFTSFAPALQFLFYPDDHLRVSQCPYKSPQAWAICQISFHFFSFLSYIMPLVVGTEDEHVTPTWTQWRHRFERGKQALGFASWYYFDKHWYDRRACHKCEESKDHPSLKPHGDVIHGLESIAGMLVPESRAFYHILQCMRNANLETKRKLEKASLPKEIFSKQRDQIYGGHNSKSSLLSFGQIYGAHNSSLSVDQIYGAHNSPLSVDQINDAYKFLSVDQAKDLLDILSLRYLRDPAAHAGTEAIKSYLELTIRINNAALKIQNDHALAALVPFPPQILFGPINKVQIPYDIMYQAFTCISCLIGRFQGKDLSQRIGIDHMFPLLISILARRESLVMESHIMKAMFTACQEIKQQLQHMQAEPAMGILNWATNAFASPDINDEVIMRWKDYPDYTKLKHLIQKLDDLWNRDNQSKSIAQYRAWPLTMEKFLTTQPSRA